MQLSNSDSVTNECLFCGFEKFELIAQNALSYAIRDKYPVSKLHTLIISKAHYPTVFELPDEEILSLFALADICRRQILAQDSSVRGFNFGANVGAAAGQKILHVHFHLIPRRDGDAYPPIAH